MPLGGSMYKTQRELAGTCPCYHITLQEYSFGDEEVVHYFEATTDEEAKNFFASSCEGHSYWSMCTTRLFCIDADERARWVATKDPSNDFLRKHEPKVF